jgi:hypothetical protein
MLPGLRACEDRHGHESSVGRAMSGEPENLVLQLLRGLRDDIVRLDAKLDETRVEFKAELRSEINSLRADVASDLLAVQKQIASLRKETGEQIAGLRQTVVEYHSAVIGHGFLIGDLDARMRRVERHLDLPPLVAD